jgi:hypothetical protein
MQLALAVEEKNHVGDLNIEDILQALAESKKSIH